MSTTKHTPPYAANQTGNDYEITTAADVDCIVAQNLTAEDAAFIVRACNAHAALLEAAEGYENWLSGCGGDEERLAERKDLQAVIREAKGLPALPTKPKWTAADSDFAVAEGWDVFDIDSTGKLQIQRHDEDDLVRFASDEAAISHVCRCAEAGSALHRKALAITKEQP